MLKEIFWTCYVYSLKADFEAFALGISIYHNNTLVKGSWEVFATLWTDSKSPELNLSTEIYLDDCVSVDIQNAWSDSAMVGNKSRSRYFTEMHLFEGPE